MNNTRLRPLLAQALVLCLPCVALAETTPTPPSKSAKAAQRCEDAVAQTVKDMRGREAQEVEFIAAKRVLRPEQGDETRVQGHGRYRGAVGAPTPFTYGCAYDAKTDNTSGVVFRDQRAALAQAAAEAAWQPDLSKLSPEACETATAAALKDKHPRVARIVFGSDSRQMRPAPNGRSSLEGQGAVQRAAGMSAIPFSYRCVYDPNSGRVVEVQTTP